MGLRITKTVWPARGLVPEKEERSRTRNWPRIRGPAETVETGVDGAGAVLPRQRQERGTKGLLPGQMESERLLHASCSAWYRSKGSYATALGVRSKRDVIAADAGDESPADRSRPDPRRVLSGATPSRKAPPEFWM